MRTRARHGERGRGRAFRQALFLRAFRRDTRGGVSVEFALWIPFLMGLLLFAIDTSLAFARQSSFMSVSRETARIVARHGLGRDEAEAYAARRAAFSGHRPDVAVALEAGRVTVTISAETRAVAPFGALGLVAGGTISASVTQILEPI